MIFHPFRDIEDRDWDVKFMNIESEAIDFTFFVSLNFNVADYAVACCWMILVAEAADIGLTNTNIFQNFTN